jgi:hypothetical protein
MDCIVAHNHLINNVIFSLIDADGKSKLPEAVWRNVKRVRSAAFDTIRDLAKPGRTFVLTNTLLDNDPEDAEWFQDVVQLARDRNAFFLPVRLTDSHGRHIPECRRSLCEEDFGGRSCCSAAGLARFEISPFVTTGVT